MTINQINNNYMDDEELFLNTSTINKSYLDECSHDEEINSMFQDTVSKDIDSINDMHIILYDNDCSDSFFERICEILEHDGLNFTRTKDLQQADVEDSTIITLDQQYSSGSNTLIFAPYDNTRLGYSDSLALAMNASFQHNGFSSNKILSGKVGFREEKDGKISNLVPTETEDFIDVNHNASFVTISFGTDSVEPEMVAKSIEEGLVRQKLYLEKYDSQTDLIYRATAGEDASVVADYFGSTVYELGQYNNLKSLNTLDSQTIINPNVKNMDIFNKDRSFSLSTEKTHSNVY